VCRIFLRVPILASFLFDKVSNKSSVAQGGLGRRKGVAIRPGVTTKQESHLVSNKL
jgi:hypothetical protein